MSRCPSCGQDDNEQNRFNFAQRGLFPPTSSQSFTQSSGYVPPAPVPLNDRLAHPFTRQSMYMPPGAGLQHMQTFGLPHRHAGQERFISQGANTVPYNRNLGNMEVNGTTIPTQPLNNQHYSAESQLRPHDRPGFGSGCKTAVGSGGYCLNQCYNFLQCGHKCMQHRTTPHSICNCLLYTSPSPRDS